MGRRSKHNAHSTAQSPSQCQFLLNQASCSFAVELFRTLWQYSTAETSGSSAISVVIDWLISDAAR